MNHHQIKVLFITYEYGKNVKGGIARVINGVSEELKPKITLDILVDRSPYFVFNLNLFWINWFNMIQIKWYKVFKFRDRSVRVNNHLQFKTALINLMKRENYDLIHLFHMGDFTENAIKIIRKNFPQVKIVYSCHSIAKYDIAVRNSFTNQLGYEHFIVSNIDHLHLLNRTSLSYLKQSYPQTDRPVTYSIIPNGVAEQDFMKKASRFERKIQHRFKNDDRITVLSMSRWSYGKGLEYLLEAIPRVTEEYPNIRFVLAGRKSLSWENGFDEYLKMLQQRIEDVKDYVVVFGWLKDQERNTLFTHADIWVMPSLLEYFPYSILEPMAARIPIVAARIDSAQEILEDRSECLFYEPTNSEQLAQRIVELAKDPKLRKSMAEQAYRKIKDRYQWENISDQYLQMYQEVLSEKRLTVL